MPTDSSFIRLDSRLIGELIPTKALSLHQSKGKATYFLNILKMTFSLLFSNDTKLCLTWFADYHAFVMVLLCRLLHKKSVIFLGGYDSVHYPEFAYGVYHSPIRAFCASFALKHCAQIVAIHEALIDSDNFYYNAKGHPEGVFRLIPKLKTPANTIYNCLTKAKPISLPPIRQKQILTVGTTPRYQDFYNKGYDLLTAAAKHFTDWQFIFVGIEQKWQERLEAEFGLSKIPNLTLYPFLPQEEVLSLMLNSDIYAQPSISEGMPYSLVEAMYYGCKPLGSDVSGIPTIIADWGVVVKHRDSALLIEGLKGLMEKEINRKAMHKDIAERFSKERRKADLKRVLSPLIG